MMERMEYIELVAFLRKSLNYNALLNETKKRGGSI